LDAALNAVRGGCAATDPLNAADVTACAAWHDANPNDGTNDAAECENALGGGRCSFTPTCFIEESCGAIDPSIPGDVATCGAVVNNGVATTCTGAGSCAYTAASGGDPADFDPMPNACNAACNAVWKPYYFCAHFNLDQYGATLQGNLAAFKARCEAANPLDPDPLDPMSLCALEDVKKNHGFGNYIAKGTASFGSSTSGRDNGITVQSLDGPEGGVGAALRITSGGNY
jgi:hypothetical protein